MLQNDEHGRLSIKEILDHPYVSIPFNKQTVFYDNGFELTKHYKSFNSRD